MGSISYSDIGVYTMGQVTAIVRIAPIEQWCKTNRVYADDIVQRIVGQPIEIILASCEPCPGPCGEPKEGYCH